MKDLDIDTVKELNAQAGYHWFDTSTMETWNTIIETGIIADDYFITSDSPGSMDRGYTIRKVNRADWSIDTLGGADALNKHDTLKQALIALCEHLNDQ